MNNQQVKATRSLHVPSRGDLSFHEILNTDYFTDKTLYLKYIFDLKSATTAFLAPPRFGKTVNLSMIREFYGAHVSAEGITLPQSKSPYYDTFFNEKLNIWKLDNGAFVKEHFAQYPVIWIDLREFIANKDYENHLTRIMKLLYLDHEYLLKSNALSKMEKDNYQVTFNDLLQKDGSLDCQAGKFLLRCLFKHFKKKVFILVEEFDCPAKAAFGAGIFGDTQEIALDGLSRYFSIMCKGDPHVFTVAFTGVTRIGDTMSYHINMLDYISAFDDETISDYFGFTETEVNKIATKLGKEELLDEIAEFYDGYIVTNTTKSIYNTQSVIMSFKTGEVKSFYQGKIGIHRFKHLLPYHVLGAEIDRTLFDEMTIELVEKITKDHLISFQEVLQEGLSSRISVTAKMLFFQFLQEQGFYTKVNQSRNIAKIRVPNEEMRIDIQKLLYTSKFFAEKLEIDIICMEKYLNALEQLDGSLPAFKNWKEAILRMFEKRRPKDEREITSALFTFPWVANPDKFVLVRTEKYIKKNPEDVKEAKQRSKEIQTDNKGGKKETTYGGKIDNLVAIRKLNRSTKNHTVIIVENKCKSESGYEALQQILKGQYYNLDTFETKAERKDVPSQINNLILIGLAYNKNEEWEMWTLFNSTDIKDAVKI